MSAFSVSEQGKELKAKFKFKKKNQLARYGWELI